jgi:6-phosphofructokinase 2
MVAGIVFKLYNQRPIEEAVKFGVACGSAATMNTGTELCKPEDVERLFAEINRTSL